MKFRAKITGGVAASALLLLVVAVLSYRAILRNSEDSRWVTHTHLEIEKLAEVQTNLLDAETGQRGYLLTGEEPFLAPYNDAGDRVRANIKDLRQLTADNPNQQRNLDVLQPLIDAELKLMEAHIEVRRQADLTPTVAVVKEGSVKALVDQIRGVISGMQEEEHRLLRIRAQNLEASSRQIRTVILTGNALAFIFLIAAGFLIQQEMKRRREVEEQVRMLNLELENRVAQRTAELAERAKDLERSNEELQQFAYVASHDLQEPLRTIASFTQLLAKRYEDKLDDKAREFIGFAVDGSKRMQTLINDLLRYSRVGTQGKPPEPVHCDEIVDRVLKSLKRAIDDSGAAITRDLLPVVLADEVQLSQLFQNLLGNAMKFRGMEPLKIHIGAEPAAAGWKIWVRDNGIGIAPEHKDRIFVIFQRLHTKAQYPGTGIGLAICKKIAERHGGRIWLEPTPGGGSTFFFTVSDGILAKEQESYELRVHATAD